MNPYENLECDDMLEGPEEICAGDMDYCSSLRWRCKRADDYYYKQDGQHYYQRFVIFTKHKRIDGKLTRQYVLKDKEHKFEDVPLVNKEDAYSLIEYLYKLVDKIDELGGDNEEM